MNRDMSQEYPEEMLADMRVKRKFAQPLFPQSLTCQVTLASCQEGLVLIVLLWGATNFWYTD